MDLFVDISSDSSLTDDESNDEKICPVCNVPINPFEKNLIENEDVYYHGYCLYKICCKHIRAKLNKTTSSLHQCITFEFKGRLYCDMPCAAKKTHTPYTEFPHCLKCKKILHHNVDVRVFEGKIFHNSCMKCTICKLHIISGENILVFDDGHIQHRHQAPCGTKNRRTLIQPFQKKALLRYYEINKHPTNAELEMISKHVNISVSVSKVWFQNQRARVG